MSALVRQNAFLDGFLTLTYYSLPFVFVWAARRIAARRLSGVAKMAGAFVVAIGLLRLLSIPDFWHWACALALAAAVSIAGAIAAVKIAPRALKRGSRQELRAIIRRLREEVELRKAAETNLRRLVEQERSTGEARLRSYIEAAAQGIIVAAQDGRIVLVNCRTEAMFGYARDQLIGAALTTLLPAGLAASQTGVRRD